MQLVYQEEEYIELAYGSETGGHLSQAAAELTSFASLELEHRDQLPHPARRDAGLMQRANVPLSTAFSTRVN